MSEVGINPQFVVSDTPITLARMKTNVRQIVYQHLHDDQFLVGSIANSMAVVCHKLKYCHLPRLPLVWVAFTTKVWVQLVMNDMIQLNSFPLMHSFLSFLGLQQSLSYRRVLLSKLHLNS